MRHITIEKVLQVCLAVLLFLLPWQTIWIYKEQLLNGVKWEYGTLGFYGTEGLLWVAVVLFMVWFVKKVKFSITNFQFSKDRRFVLSLLIFILYCFASILWSADQNVALQQSLHVMEAVILFLMLFIGPLSAERAMMAFVGGGVLQSILGIWQFLSQSTIKSTLLGLAAHPAWEAGASVVVNESGRWLRAYGAFPNPNVFGGYLVVSLLFCVVLLMNNEQLAMNKKVVYLGVVLQLIALFFTFSRAAWLAAAIVLLFHCSIVIREKKSIHLVYLLSLISVLSILFFPLIQTRVSDHTLNEQRSITERVSGYKEAFGLWKKHPLLGVGAGNYTAALYATDSNRAGWSYQPVHDVPLLVLSELGVFGVLLFIGVLISFIIYHLSLVTFQRKRLFFWYVLCCVCYVLLGTFDHYLFSSYIGLLLTGVYWALVARSSPQFLHSPSTEKM